MEKWAYRGDNFVGIYSLIAIINCYASGAVSLEAYREPDPGSYWGQQQVSVTFYGFGIQTNIPGGDIAYSYDGGTVAWGCVKWPFWWAPAVTIGGADFTIGFRIHEDAAATISANSNGLFYHTFWGIPLGGGDGPTAAVYVPQGA